VSGLNANIRREVLIHTPTSLVKAFSLAKVYEEKYASSTKPQKTTTNSYLTNKLFANKIENSPRNLAPILNTKKIQISREFLQLRCKLEEIRVFVIVVMRNSQKIFPHPPVYLFNPPNIQFYP
jgi:hypothetical protein